MIFQNTEIPIWSLSFDVYFSLSLPRPWASASFFYLCKIVSVNNFPSNQDRNNIGTIAFLSSSDIYGSNDISLTQLGQLQNLPLEHVWVKVTQEHKEYPNKPWLWRIWVALTHNHSIWTIWILAHWLIMVRSRKWSDLRSQISIRDNKL